MADKSTWNRQEIGTATTLTATCAGDLRQVHAKFTPSSREFERPDSLARESIIAWLSDSSARKSLVLLGEFSSRASFSPTATL